MLPSPRVLRTEIERAGLTVARSVEFGDSYSQTLRRWHDTFNSRWAEIGRLALSVADSKRFEYERLWAMIHYPPVYSWGLETEFVPILKDAGVEQCVYGHLHGRDHRSGFVGDRDGITYHLASCDYTEMKPIRLR